MEHAIHHRKITSRFATELWKVGIVQTPIASLLNPYQLAQTEIHWLPAPGNFRFIADPFGIAQDGKCTIFVEALDYRIKRGEIHYYEYDHGWNLLGQGIALQAPHHLSYPFLIPSGDAIYMLPEAHKIGKLTLYRAVDFPSKWEPVATLLHYPAIDASIVEWNGRWWMFYALPGPDGRALRELHIAYADRLLGPWHPHAQNPVRNTRESSRPGGTPFIQDGMLYLPTQDCAHSYGEAIRLLRIDQLTPDVFAATAVTRLTPEGLLDGYDDGLHTLAAMGNYTLIDVKRIDPSPQRRWINLERRMRRLLGQR